MKNCVLNIDGQFAIEIFSVAEIFRCMYGGKGIPQKAKFMQALSTKRLDTNTRSTTNFRFNVHVWKELSRIEVDSKTTPRVFQSFQLLEQCGSDDARRRLDERRNGQETDENYMLATLFADKVTESGDGFFCICSIFGSMNSSGLAIYNVAVTDENYVSKKFGRGSDGKSFKGRGVGSFMVGLCQSLLKGIYGTDICSCKCVKEIAPFWKKMGFQESPSDVEEHVIQLNIAEPVSYFYTQCQVSVNTLSPTELCIIYHEPFMIYPQFAVPRNDHELVLSHFSTDDVQHVGNLSSQYCSLLLKTLRYKKDTILYERSSSEINIDVSNILKSRQFIQNVVVDYIFMMMMMSDRNLYVVSSSVSSIIYRQRYSLCYRECVDNIAANSNDVETKKYEGMLSEFHLLQHLADEPEFIFLIPFHYVNHWVLIMRKWINGELFFFYADSNQSSCKSLEESMSKGIPEKVLLLVLDSPLLPLNVRSRWINVPTKRQSEDECGARCLVHGYMMSMLMKLNPHMGLLNLNKVTRLSCSCRQWVHDVLHLKKFVAPTFCNGMKVDNFDSFSNQEWVEQNSLSYCYDEEQYRLLYHSVRQSDLIDGQRGLTTDERSQNNQNTLVSSTLSSVTTAGDPHIDASVVCGASTDERNTCSTVRTADEPHIDDPHIDGTNAIGVCIDEKNTHSTVTSVDEPHIDASTVVGVANCPPTICSPVEPSIPTIDEVIAECPLEYESDEDRPFRKCGGKHFRQVFNSDSDGDGNDVNSGSKIVSFGDTDSELSDSSGDSVHLGGKVLRRCPGKILRPVSAIDETDETSTSTDYSSDTVSMKGGTQTNKGIIQDDDKTEDEDEVVMTQLDGVKGGTQTNNGIRQDDDDDEYEFEDEEVLTWPEERNSVYDMEHDKTDDGEANQLEERKMDDDYEYEFNDCALKYASSSTKRVGRKAKASFTILPAGIDPNCLDCGSRVRKVTNCNNCQGPLHASCGFIVKNDRQLPVKVCHSCHGNSKRYRSFYVHESIIESHGIIEAPNLMDKGKPLVRQKKFNDFLKTMQEMKVIIALDGSERKYIGRNKRGEEKSLKAKLVEDVLLCFFENDLNGIQSQSKEKNSWFSLSDQAKKYISIHARCFAIDELYEKMDWCESTEWMYMKLKCYQRRLPQPYKLIDLPPPRTKIPLNGAYLCLTNNINDQFDAVHYVPLYFLEKWKKAGVREFSQAMIKAERNVNEWVEIDAGSFKATIYNVQHHESFPISHRIQQYGEFSCVFNSLANALNYINDFDARNKILENLQASMNYEEFNHLAKTRKAFAAYLMNFEVKGYEIQMIRRFDILSDRSMWPTLCILQGTDNGINHAVTVVENYIFDSNNHTAILLSKENLDLCCQSELVSEVHFQKVHMAYRFVKHNAPCQYYLRSSMKYNYALSAIFQCFSYLEATEVVESIQRLDLNTIVNCDIIGIVRNLLNRKPHGYQPKSLKCYDELLVRASECYPIIALMCVQNSFQYSILCMVNGLIFNGRDSSTLPITVENMIGSIVGDGFSDDDLLSINLVKGYVFYKGSSINSVSNVMKKKIRY